jgi:hypothetical protein
MAKRKPMSNKLRFEVLKRDGFTCQYCGSKAPEVILHVDHIKPVKKNGDNNILNLITSCKRCNFGKGITELSDNAVFQKQLDQLEELNEKREQIEMMVKWRTELYKLDDKIFQIAHEHWKELSGFGCNDNGNRKIKSLIRTYGLQSVLEAMDISAEKYLITTEKGFVSEESWTNGFDKIGGICYYSSLSEERQESYKKIGIVKSIIKTNFNYYEAKTVNILINNYFDSGGNFDHLIEITKNAPSWSRWKLDVEAETKANQMEKNNAE